MNKEIKKKEIIYEIETKVKADKRMELIASKIKALMEAENRTDDKEVNRKAGN